MARTNDFPRVLWLVTSTWLVGCGRVGFGDLDRGPSDPLADAPLVVDAAAPVDVAVVDVAEPVIDGPVTPAPAGPKLTLATVPPMTTTCGQAPAPVNVDLSNEGDQDLVITKLPSNVGGFQIALTTGPIVLPMTIVPAAKVTLRITPPQAVIGSDQGGTLKTDTLTIESNGTGALSVGVELHATVMGANIVVTTPAPPASLVFTGTSGVCPTQKAATIRNDGNVAATINVGVPADFAMTGASGASIAGGATLTRNFRPFTNGPCGASAVIQYTVTAGANCGSSAGVAAAINATFNISGASTCFCS